VRLALSLPLLLQCAEFAPQSRLVAPEVIKAQRRPERRLQIIVVLSGVADGCKPPYYDLDQIFFLHLRQN
jgi:hypothetical protein